MKDSLRVTHGNMVPVAIAEQLERERDEAVKTLRTIAFQSIRAEGREIAKRFLARIDKDGAKDTRHLDNHGRDMRVGKDGKVDARFLPDPDKDGAR